MLFVALVAAFTVCFQVQAVSASAIPVQVALEAQSDGVVATYRFQKPVTEFQFENTEAYDGFEDAVPLRRATWHVTDEGFVFDGLLVQRADGQPFSSFSLLAEPDIQSYDRVYPAIYRMGASAYTFFTRYFYGNQDQFETYACLQTHTGCVNWEHEAESSFIEEGMYLSLGDIVVRQIDGFSFYAADSVPVFLADHVAAFLAESAINYTAIFGFDAPKASSVYVTYAANDDMETNFTGSVAEGPTMVLFIARKIDPSIKRADLGWLRAFIAHEVVHYWNGGLFVTDDEEQQPWLHEGSATYFAEVQAPDTRVPVETAQAWMNGCAATVSEKSLDGRVGPLVGKAPYDCGALIHWLLDAGLRQASENKITAATVWRQMFAGVAGSDRRQYSAALFKTLVLQQPGGAKLWPAIDTILGSVGDRRWDRLVAQAADFGIELRPSALEEYDPADMFMPILFTFLDEECSAGNRGFYYFDDYVKLDTGDRCGPMSGDPAIRTIDGFSLYHDTAALYRHLVSACKAHALVTFSSREKGSPDFSVECKAMPEVLPQAYQITRLPEMEMAH